MSSQCSIQRSLNGNLLDGFIAHSPPVSLNWDSVCYSSSLLHQVRYSFSMNTSCLFKKYSGQPNLLQIGHDEFDQRITTVASYYVHQIFCIQFRLEIFHITRAGFIFIISISPVLNLISFSIFNCCIFLDPCLVHTFISLIGYNYSHQIAPSFSVYCLFSQYRYCRFCNLIKHRHFVLKHFQFYSLLSNRPQNAWF